VKPAAKAALSAEGLRVRLGGSEILHGVDIEVAEGWIVGVLGPSGSGKTTLFRALSGELPLREGRVHLAGKDVTRLPLWARARAGLGYVPQTPSVLWDLSVAENIRTFASLCRTDPAQIGRITAELELESRLTLRASALSGGERRRLELLRALVASPTVLILDEPLSGLDPGLASRVCGILRARAEAGLAILLSDHRVREALAVCDHALLLADGRVELEADPREFADHPAVVRRYLG
jgi:lipopolysaccharide export system ATP-binding protein